MATKTGVIQLSGLKITEKVAGSSVLVQGSSGVKLAYTTVDDTAVTKKVSKKTADYILEDFKQLFTGNRASVSLFGSDVDEFDASSADKYAGVKIINATAVSSVQALTLTGNDSANQIIANNGGATLDGGAGNDTLTGGKGADMFIYNAGKDIIKGFTASNDSISVDGAAVTNASVSGSNVILKIDNSNTLTVEGMAKKSLVFTDDDGQKTLTGGILYSDDSAVITSAFATSSQTSINAATIDASAVTRAVNLVSTADAGSTMLGGSKNDTLTGSAAADSIEGGAGNDKLYGGAGNDTLWGGAGNDSLTGGDGDDTYIYSAGKDVIFGFEEGDSLTLDNITSFTSSVNKAGTEITLKIGSGSVLLKEFGNNTTFNINGDTYELTAGTSKYTLEKQ